MSDRLLYVLWAVFAVVAVAPMYAYHFSVAYRRWSRRGWHRTVERAVGITAIVSMLATVPFFSR